MINTPQTTQRTATRTDFVYISSANDGRRQTTTREAAREYRRHAGSKFRLLNEQFIELFDCDLVPTSGRWRAPAAMPFEPMASGPAAAPMPAAVPPSPTAVPPSPGPESSAASAASPGPDAEKRLV